MGSLIQPYAKSTQILFCPSDSEHSSAATFDPAAISYGWNFRYLTLADIPYNPSISYKTGSISLAQIPSVSETVMVGDSPKSDADWAIAANGTGYTQYYPPARHLEGANIAFVDGHVKWFKIPGKLDTIELWDLN